MNAEPINAQSAEEWDQELAKALVSLYRLPDEAIESIRESMRGTHLRFAEAALHTGLVTQSELDAAHDWVRCESTPQGVSIIEEALRRQSVRRELVVWEGDRLTPGRELILAHDPDNPRSEVIRTLRTELLMRTSGRRGAAMFALLSPGASEGRSQLCAELAIAFAQLGSRTLLVDADMRRPRQHSLFGADNQLGLAQALAQGNALRLHAIEGVAQMALLTSGALPPNPLELLSGSRFVDMMSDWRRAYEYVIFDTPPASRFSDALAVATAAGNVIVLGRTQSTSFNALSEMRRKLNTTQARIVGAIMNSF